MNVKITFWVMLAMLFQHVLAQPIANVESVLITSKKLGQTRELLIYTPVDYDIRTNEYFRVVYVFDSQNREYFDCTSSLFAFLNKDNSPYIVVGITSTYNAALDYSRNNDFLPVLETEKDKQRFGRYAGNADNFLAFVADEVRPYIDSNYRTLPVNIAVGHSLGASFILYTFTKSPQLFDAYIAISPNLAYDNNKLGTLLTQYNYQQIDHPTFIYLSHADEGINYWHDWKPARDQVYAFYRDSFSSEYVRVELAEFPQHTHLNTFPISLMQALNYYFDGTADAQLNGTSATFYETTIRLAGVNETDTVYITGNQENLGAWNPHKVAMKKISDTEREITLQLQSPAQLKFTLGSWEAELSIFGAFSNVIIKPEKQTRFVFQVEQSEQ